MMAGENIEMLAARTAALGIGLISLRLFSMIVSPARSVAFDTPEFLCLWLSSSPIVQVLAIVLAVGGSAVWTAATLSKAQGERFDLADCVAHEGGHS